MRVREQGDCTDTAWHILAFFGIVKSLNAYGDMDIISVTVGNTSHNDFSQPTISENYCLHICWINKKRVQYICDQTVQNFIIILASAAISSGSLHVHCKSLQCECWQAFRGPTHLDISLKQLEQWYMTLIHLGYSESMLSSTLFTNVCLFPFTQKKSYWAIHLFTSSVNCFIAIRFLSLPLNNRLLKKEMNKKAVVSLLHLYR